MNKYLFIESSDPFGSDAVERHCELATDLKRAGHDVAVFLVQNASLAAREGARAPWLAALAEMGIELLADDFSLRERGITAGRMRRGMRMAPISHVVEQLAAGTTTIWQ